jgi:hypothetical protein
MAVWTDGDEVFDTRVPRAIQAREWYHVMRIGDPQCNRTVDILQHNFADPATILVPDFRLACETSASFAAQVFRDDAPIFAGVRLLAS